MADKSYKEAGSSGRKTGQESSYLELWTASHRHADGRSGVDGDCDFANIGLEGQERTRGVGAPGRRGKEEAKPFLLSSAAAGGGNLREVNLKSVTGPVISNFAVHVWSTKYR
jgi:hypothetical protein